MRSFIHTNTTQMQHKYTKMKNLYESTDHAWALDYDASPPLLYEVVIRSSQRGPKPSFPTTTLVEDDGTDEKWCWWYFIHFQGWNVKWDKWIPEKDLVSDSPENRELAKTRMKEARARKRGNKASTITTKCDKEWLVQKQQEIEQKKQVAVEKGASKVVNNLKRKNSGDVEIERTAGASCDDDEMDAAAKRRAYLHENDLEEVRSEVQEMSLPFALKKVMINEHQRVTEKAIGPNGYPQRMVADLPSSLPVRTVLEQYRDTKVKLSKNVNGKTSLESWDYMVEGLLSFFDSVLPILCLYNQEKAQCRSLEKHENLKHLKYSEIYGAEFLLRFLVQLPTLLTDYRSQSIPNTMLKNISLKVNDLLRYLEKHQSKMFRQTYRIPLVHELMNQEAKI